MNAVTIPASGRLTDTCTGRGSTARNCPAFPNQTDTIPVSSTGSVSVANHTSAPLDVVMTLMSYYTGNSDTDPGDTYFDAPWDKIVDTTAGLGAPEAQIPASGSLTIQVSGEGGIASGADTAVIQLSALNATTNGYLDAYAAEGADPGISELFYDAAMTYRDIVYVPCHRRDRSLSLTTAPRRSTWLCIPAGTSCPVRTARSARNTRPSALAARSSSTGQAPAALA
jgi:hypothetical protein